MCMPCNYEYLLLYVCGLPIISLTAYLVTLSLQLGCEGQYTRTKTKLLRDFTLNKSSSHSPEEEARTTTCRCCSCLMIPQGPRTKVEVLRRPVGTRYISYLKMLRAQK